MSHIFIVFRKACPLHGYFSQNDKKKSECLSNSQKPKKSFTYNSYKNPYNLSMNHCDIVNFTEILGRFWIFKKRIRSKFYLRPFSWRKLFSSPKPKVHVSFSYQLMSVICLSFLSFLSCVKINIILIIIVPGRHEIL